MAPPLRDFECLACGSALTSILIRNAQDLMDLRCPCGSGELQQKLALIGGYNGDTGGGSTKPKGAGSFRTKK
jgi:DNA-directed RNA polymerase subunit RPC12/RpoP